MIYCDACAKKEEPTNETIVMSVTFASQKNSVMSREFGGIWRLYM